MTEKVFFITIGVLVFIHTLLAILLLVQFDGTRVFVIGVLFVCISAIVGVVVSECWRVVVRV